jgi:hypothetical protein
LKDVKIEAPNGTVSTFSCNKWFDPKEEDGDIEKVLYPTPVEQTKKSPK